MDVHELTSRLIEHGEKLASHEEELKTLFNQQKNIENLAASSYELAQSVKELTVKVNDVDGRLEAIESEKRNKSFAVWQIVMSALIGGAITYCVTLLLH